MEDNSSGSGTQGPATNTDTTRNNGRKSSQGGDGDAEGDADEETSSSSSSYLGHQETPESALENFRRQWEAELGKSSAVNINANSALNLASATPASLACAYPNPTSMAGAVSMSKPGDHHPFAAAVTSVNFEDKESQGANTSSMHESSPVKNIGSVEEQAKKWFLQGVGFERHGDLFEAVRCYRKAVQLVPDIEYKIGQGLVEEKHSDASGNESDTDAESIVQEENDNNENDVDVEEDPVLIRRFLKQIEHRDWNFFIKLSETGKTHIGDLPVEALEYILRWVVSKDLDVRSLDVISGVSKGFYCIARDEKLWEMVCQRVWPACSLDTSIYLSYRHMFLSRPRVRFDGLYISKITYIRAGEGAFQDLSYRPWHFVEYYRYIRFFPDGQVFFLTSTDDPNVVIPGLREKNPRNQLTMKGKYEVYGNNFISALVKKPIQASSGFSRKRQEPHQQTSFHIEFNICSLKGRNNWMLKWSHHGAFITKPTLPVGRNARQNQNNPSTVTSTTFDINPTKYPPLIFSRVKSYTTRSETILE